MPLRRLRFLASVVVATALLAACSASSAGTPHRLRLGYFANLTHAPAVAGIHAGILQRHLGTTKLQTSIFNAGPEAVQALFSGAIDAAFVGPNPAINAYTRSKGEAVRVVAGATSGGAFLIVKPSIVTVADLKGKKLASPQRGNTQDVALRTWLARQRLTNTLTGGGDVSVLAQENAQTLETFRSGAIDGAWVPEPWASRLIVEGGGHVLVDERSLWPGGRYATTLLLVRTEYLRSNAAVVRKLIEGHVEAIDFVNTERDEAETVIGDAIAKITGKRLLPAVVDRAWSTLTFTLDPLVTTLRTSASNAAKLGLLETSTSLDGIADLTVLNEVLTSLGKPRIDAT